MYRAHALGILDAHFLRLLPNTTAIFTKFFKKPSPRVSPMQTSKSYRQRRAPPAAMSLYSRVRASPCYAPVFGWFCVRRGPSPCPPALGPSPVCVPHVLRRGLSVLCPLCFVSPVLCGPMLPIPLLPLSLVSNVLSPCGRDAHLA